MKTVKQQKTQRGFTLVEVIVVAIIVAALAGVAIPMYTSYVNSSRVNAASNAAGSIASFMGACLNHSDVVTSTGVTAGTEWNGTGNVSLMCIHASTPPETTSIQLPVGIRILISNFGGNGFVRAHHTGSAAAADTAHYNY